ncbi:CHAD domain-containing protein [Nocardia mangyaensis]|uniref:CHAD domain-containing protein n=1 Tax=Nocardia mangyaensis TaxID=2213200 RepID=UPI002676E68F|nr:CHAD domain-containing protein [Nocardia mangyaensis]MDO3646969.1 CHAD domain-containing protein [Nocardia mangyaensis]
MTIEAKAGDRVNATDEPPLASRMLARYLHTQRETIMDGQIAVHDDPDAVGEMVIAARRARCALSAYRPAVRHEPEVRRLIEELRWFGINVSAAHELRTQAARLHEAVDLLRPRYVRGPVRARMTNYFQTRTRPAWRAARDMFGSPRFPALIEDLMCEERLLNAGLVPGIDDSDNAVVLAALLERVRRRMRAVESARDEDGTDASMHDLRKALRRTRYYLESVYEMNPARSAQAAEGLAAVQDLLGQNQDAAVAKQHLIQLTREAENAGESTFTYGLLLQREIDRTTICAAGLPAVYWGSLRAVRAMADVHADAPLD